MTDAKLQRVRELFPILQRRVYFDHASDGPLPVTAVAAIHDAAERRARDGRVPYAEAEAVVEDARAMAARLMRVSPGEIAFTRNTCSGIIIALNSVEWRAGDNLVMMKDAFPSDSYPFYYLLPQVEKRFVSSRELAAGPDCVFPLCDRRTRLVALDWVSFLAGVRADIQAIGEFCRALGILFVVDAIQGLGAVDMDFRAVNADFACASTAKWLFGPQGIGLMYVRAETMPRLRPYNLGWLSARWTDFNDILTIKELKTDASRYEEGTRNYIGIYGLREGIRVLLDAGQPEVEMRIRRLCDQLRAGLARLGFEILTPEEPRRNAGIVTVRRSDQDTAALHRHLDQAHCNCSLRQDCLRIAPHFYNTDDEVARFLTALAEGIR
jgi:selenocysteine lyase/cysteine desulfurase